MPPEEWQRGEKPLQQWNRWHPEFFEYPMCENMMLGMPTEPCWPEMIWKEQREDDSVENNLRDVTVTWDITTKRCIRPDWFTALGTALAYAPNVEFVLTLVIISILMKCGCIQAKHVHSMKDLWKVAAEEDEDAESGAK